MKHELIRLMLDIGHAAATAALAVLVAWVNTKLNQAQKQLQEHTGACPDKTGDQKP